MTDSLAADRAARAAAVAHARQVIALLSPGAAVGHANPELADWEGVIEADRGQRWRGTDDVRVRWTAGTDGLGGPLADSKPSWHDATAVTVKGPCPGCGRPARYVSAGNQYGVAGGWHHDAGDDTCRAGTDGTVDTPDVIEGTIAPEDLVRANMRAAGFPVGSAADARAVRAEAERWAQDFAAASRAEDAIVLGPPGPGEERENW